MRQWTFRPLTAPGGEYAVVRSKLIFYFVLDRDKPEVLPAQEIGRSADEALPVEFQEVDEAVANKLVKGGAVLLDIRPRREFEAGHKAGAINIPESELTPRSRVEIPANATVVLDCSGSAASLCPYAVRILQRAGIEDGFIVRHNPDR